MEFTTLPPEVTSALIHTGPGAESLIEASEAWQQLGANLEDSAENYGATLSSLVGTWRGASSTAMVQAVEPYVNWLRTTAQQVQQTAASAQAAASAVNSVRAAVVPVGQVSANRALLAQLLATNRIREESSGYRRNRSRIPEHVGEQLGGDDSLSGGLGTSQHAAAVLLAIFYYQSGGDGQAVQRSVRRYHVLHGFVVAHRRGGHPRRALAH